MYQERLKLCVTSLSLFFAVYAGSIGLIGYRSDVHRLAMEWEASIPLVPGFAYVYLSVLLVVLLPAFVLDLEQARELAIQYNWCFLICGLIFLLFPTTATYGSLPDPDRANVALSLIKAVDRPYNLFPSMHVTLSILCARALSLARPELRVPLLLWLPASVLSVLLVHQHHLADVLGGFLVALLIVRRELLQKINTQ